MPYALAILEPVPVQHHTYKNCKYYEIKFRNIGGKGGEDLDTFAESVEATEPIYVSVFPENMAECSKPEQPFREAPCLLGNSEIATVNYKGIELYITTNIDKDGICYSRADREKEMACDSLINEVDGCIYTHAGCTSYNNGVCTAKTDDEGNILYQIERGGTKYNCSDILGVDPKYIRRVKSSANKLSDCVLVGGGNVEYEDNAGTYTFGSSECSELYCTDLTSDLCTSV